MIARLLAWFAGASVTPPAEHWVLGAGFDHRSVEWACLECVSGTGQAPTVDEAEQAAASHHRAVHTNESSRAS